MTAAIIAACLKLYTHAGTLAKYWQDVTQVVDMMETIETRCNNKEELRNMRKEVLKIAQTTTDEQGAENKMGTRIQEPKELETKGNDGMGNQAPYEEKLGSNKSRKAHNFKADTVPQIAREKKKFVKQKEG